MLLLLLLGMFVCLGFGCWRHGWGGILGQTRGGAGIVNRTVVVGAYGDGRSRTFTVDDDGWLGRGAWQGWLCIGILHNRIDLAELPTLDGSRPLFFRATVAILDLDSFGVRVNFAVYVSVNLRLVAE